MQMGRRPITGVTARLGDLPIGSRSALAADLARGMAVGAHAATATERLNTSPLT